MVNQIKRKIKYIISLTLIMIMMFPMPVHGEEPVAISVSAEAYVLMEASTGQIICMQNADVKLHPASITKIMTLLLIFETLEQGKIHLTDEVTTSAYAKSMGGSQVFLEEGEKQTVDTLIKCIAVASGNDAAVAMAEYISGSEAEFVRRMNEKAKSLSMNETSFVDCCGLSDSTEHMMSAMDVAIVSRELITKYPQVFDYTKIWMEDITHETKNGSSPFTLSSTNKLLKQYEYTTGLKTGSTSLAKYCLSATANKNGIDLIAVVMKSPEGASRFQDAIAILNYGFGVSAVYADENKELLLDRAISRGVKDQAKVGYEDTFRYLDIKGRDLSGITKEITYLEDAKAPISKNDVAGEAKYYLDGQCIGSVNIVFLEDVKEAVYKDYFKKIIKKFAI